MAGGQRQLHQMRPKFQTRKTAVRAYRKPSSSCPGAQHTYLCDIPQQLSRTFMPDT